MKLKGGFFSSFFLLFFPLRCSGRIQPSSLSPATTGALWGASDCFRKPPEWGICESGGCVQNFVLSLVLPEAWTPTSTLVMKAGVEECVGELAGSVPEPHMTSGASGMRCWEDYYSSSGDHAPTVWAQLTIPSLIPPASLHRPLGHLDTKQDP